MDNNQEIPGGLAITREDLAKPAPPPCGLCPWVLYSQECGVSSGWTEDPCDKTFETCRDKFHNLSHFGGLMKPYEG